MPQFKSGWRLHKNNHTVWCGYFYGILGNFKCSAEVNSACAKVLPRGKTLVRRKSAAPPCGAPVPAALGRLHPLEIFMLGIGSRAAPAQFVAALGSDEFTAQKRRPTVWGPGAARYRAVRFGFRRPSAASTLRRFSCSGSAAEPPLRPLHSTIVMCFCLTEKGRPRAALFHAFSTWGSCTSGMSSWSIMVRISSSLSHSAGVNRTRMRSMTVRR